MKNAKRRSWPLGTTFVEIGALDRGRTAFHFDRRTQTSVGIVGVSVVLFDSVRDVSRPFYPVCALGSTPFHIRRRCPHLVVQMPQLCQPHAQETRTGHGSVTQNVLVVTTVSRVGAGETFGVIVWHQQIYDIGKYFEWSVETVHGKAGDYATHGTNNPV